MEGLYGKDRINKMKEVNSLLLEEIGLLEKKAKEAESNVESDKTELEKVFRAAGLKDLTFNEDGTVANAQE
jgi:hypothetical protein